MSKTARLLMLFFALTTNMIIAQSLVINELDSDTDGTDILEFIELKTTNPNQSLNGYILVFFNGNGDVSYYTIDLTGYSTDANGLFLLGNSDVNPTPSITFPSNTLQNGQDAIAIYQTDASNFPDGTAAVNTNLIDAIVYDTDDGDDTALMNALGVSQQINENENGDKNNHSIQRNNDGGYDVKTPTPGAPNDGSTPETKYRITISALQTAYTEGDVFDITFTSDVTLTEDVSFDITLTNGNFGSADFSSPSQVTISNGSTQNSITVTTVDDSDVEGDEFLKVDCSNYPTDATIINDNYSITIKDNDVSGSAWGTPLNPTYDIVSSTAPANYYSSLDNKSGETLRNAIKSIIADPSVVRAQNYGDVWDIIKEADQDPSNSLSVWLLYTEQGRSKSLQQTATTNVGTWNREHIYPQSRGGFSDGTPTYADGIDNYMTTSADNLEHAHSDAHGLRPADYTENSVRSNKDFGVEYDGPEGNSGSWKGDVARSLFFMSIRYNALDLTTGNPDNTTVGLLGDLDSLIAWHRNDPPDDYEMNRNNVVYNWQKNRNPFIDLPELAEYIWGDQIGETWNPSVGIEDSTPIKKIKIYPNPASSIINFNNLSEGTYFIADINGRTVMSGELNASYLNIERLGKGVYIIKVKQEDKVYIGRFIRN